MLLVVVNHVFGFPVGGFIGVDVFFVISGFLITGLLVREYDRNGRISIQDFYVRRAKRILPAAVATLLVTVILAFIVWYRPRALQTLYDAVAALLFASNWHSVRLGTDYLQADAPPSPVQHFWSLSVEEQFYIFWPLLIIATLAVLVRRLRWNRTVVLLVVLGGVSVATFAWAVLITDRAPEFAYFDTVSRVWELGAGAVLAVVAPRVRLSVALASTLTWAGLLVIVAGAFLLSATSPFPGPWAIVPVGGTVLVLTAGCAGFRTTPVLSNPVTQYVGRISYSLYLWHFPLIVFAHSLFGNSALVNIVSFGFMLAVSAASYRWIEQPFQRTRATRGRATRGRRQMRLTGQLVLAATVAFVLVGASAAQLRGPDTLVSPLSATAPATKKPAQIDPVLDTPERVSEAVVKALEDPASVDVDVSGLSASLATPEMSLVDGCRNSLAKTGEPNVCDYPGGPQRALIVGDSVAMSWVPAIREALPGWSITAIGYAACPAVPVDVGDAGVAALCNKAQEAMLGFAGDLAPDLVFTSSAQSSLTRLSSGAAPDAAAREWDEATVRLVQAVDGDVVILGSPPAGIHPNECLTRFTGIDACASEIDDLWYVKREAEARAAAASGARFIDVENWFCADRACPMALGSTVLRYDGAHLTHDASASYGRVLNQALALGD
ncbi:peptidoglycan/LPS O-acetylase OafA/YrhL [Microbacterium sp. SLBN-111]